MRKAMDQVKPWLTKHAVSAAGIAGAALVALYFLCEPLASPLVRRVLYTCWGSFECGNVGDWVGGIATAATLVLLYRQHRTSEDLRHTKAANALWERVYDCFIASHSRAAEMEWRRVPEEFSMPIPNLVASADFLKHQSELPKPLPHLLSNLCIDISWAVVMERDLVRAAQVEPQDGFDPHPAAAADYKEALAAVKVSCVSALALLSQYATVALPAQVVAVLSAKKANDNAPAKAPGMKPEA